MSENEFLSQSIMRMDENTPRIEKCFDLLSEQQVWQRPNSSSNSIANLVLHLCGNITQYIISSLGNQVDTRQRNLEFSTTKGYNKKELMTLLKKTVDHATKVISECPVKELNRVRNVQGFELSGTGIIIHVVEHYSYHTGQIALWTKLLVDKDLGFYADIDLQVNNQ